MPLVGRRLVRMPTAATPLRPAVLAIDVAFHMIDQAFASLASRLPAPPLHAHPGHHLLPTDPTELADQLEAEEGARAYTRAVELAAIAEDLGDLAMRQRAGLAGAILARRRPGVQGSP